MYNEARWNYFKTLEAEHRPQGWFYSERGSSLRDDVQLAFADGDWARTAQLCAESSGQPFGRESWTEDGAKTALHAFFTRLFAEA